MSTEDAGNANCRKVYKGRWWLPSHDDEVQLGTLEYDVHDGLTLEVNLEGMFGGKGAWGTLVKKSQTEHDRIPVLVHGQDQGGTLFTLYDGFVRESSTGGGGSTAVSLFFNRGIRGACINSPSELPIHCVSARYYGLDAWLAINPFKIDMAAKPEYRVSIVHELPDSIRIPVDSNRTVAVSWTSHFPQVDNNALTMSATPSAGIEYRTPVTIEEASEDTHAFADLLSLLLGQPTTGYEVEYQSPEVQDCIEEHKFYPALYSMAAHFRLTHQFNKWTMHDVLLPFPRVKGDLLAQIVPQWFRLRDSSLAIGPYFSEQRRPASFVNGQFFNYARTAEALHRDLRPEVKLFPDADAAKLRSAIMAVVPEDRKGYVRSCLKQLNSLSFRNRIEEMMRRFPQLSTEVVGDESAQALFARKVRDLRDAEAHLLEERSVNKKQGIVYIRFASKLRALIDAWLLSEVGCSEELLGDAMRSNRRYWYYASNRSWPWNA